MKKLAVFCGSSVGVHPAYKEAAWELGKQLVNHNIALIYGGSKNGIMGEIANTMLEHKGEVVGVLPHFLANDEIVHTGITQLHLVETMRERKKLILDMADGFILLPGGPGSLDEFFEALELAQLGDHKKPCGILNAHHYFDKLLHFMDHATSSGFMHERHRNMIVVEECPEKLLQAFKTYEAPEPKFDREKAG